MAKGERDPAFRTKLKLAVELVRRALEAGFSFRAVVADSLSGEDRGVRQGLRELQVGYVLALKPSHDWWHPKGSIGSLKEAAQAARWRDARHPGAWVKLVRPFRDGSQTEWWGLEVVAGPYGPHKQHRVVIATTDPQTLPDHSTMYLITNLPHPEQVGSRPDDARAPATLEELVWLYGLRMWIEPSYKQVKPVLGCSHYQVRSDRAIRRHWQLLGCAFGFCWRQHGPATPDQEQAATTPDAAPAARDRENNGRRATKPTNGRLAAGAAGGAGGARVAAAVDHAGALLARVVAGTPTAPTPTLA